MQVFMVWGAFKKKGQASRPTRRVAYMTEDTVREPAAAGNTGSAFLIVSPALRGLVDLVLSNRGRV